MVNIYVALYLLFFGIISIVFYIPIARFQLKVSNKLSGKEYGDDAFQVNVLFGGVLSILGAIAIFMELWGIWALIGGV